MQKMSRMLSLKESFKGKNILITGATGFVGKVLLSMILHRITTVEKIYVLVRDNGLNNSKDRFNQSIMSSPAFATLRDQTDNLSELIETKISVIKGDIAQQNLGINPEISKKLLEEIDLVIHLAGLVEFSPDLQAALDINVLGTLHVAEFVATCKKAVLAHISTCYVAGNQSGQIPEHILKEAPNGEYIDPELELQTLQNNIQNLTNSNNSISQLQLELIKLGETHAKKWGWTNTYTFTKALAELLLTKRYPQLRYSIIRPSIIESSLNYPFEGWNEGYNTCGPFCYLAGGWYPYVISKNEHIIDVVPVDTVCIAILMIGAALLENVHSPLYQIATSHNNPLTMKVLAKYTRHWHRQHFKITEKRWTDKYLRCLKPVKLLPPDHYLAPDRMASVLKRISKKSKELQKFPLLNNNFLLQKISRHLKFLSGKLKYLNKIHLIYKPFLYDNCYLFTSAEIKKINIIETDFQYNANTINWIDYWFNVQMPGLNKWVFPALRDEQNQESANESV